MLRAAHNTFIMKKFTPSLTRFSRRKAHEVRIGSISIGSNHPIAVQSMANCSTMDTDACVEQIRAVRDAGCRIMRFTAPGKREGENLREIAAAAREAGLNDVALVADIHFTPDVAEIAAQYVDKVRINPGNYGRMEDRLPALLARCRERGVALRIGVNHGSLAAHMVDRWGDTPRGMVESAMEFLRGCRAEGFDQVVVSMKSSNVRVMVHAYRLLAATMAAEGMDYPLHLGVTEAGDGSDARIKSAVGIGALLADGIGDTIRVSLTEPPQNEIPVAQALADYFAERTGEEPIEEIRNESLYSPYEYRRRTSNAIGNIGGGQLPLLWEELNDTAQEGVRGGEVALLEAVTGNPVAEWRARILNMEAEGDYRPVILARCYHETSLTTLQLKAAADFGPLLLDGLADGIRIQNETSSPLSEHDYPAGSSDSITPERLASTGLSIFQAARVRMSKTEYIACPGCGRTLYDLQHTLAAIRARTSHLKGLKIGVMGCIVNGPGEMADADYGYVGAGRGLVTLYKGREVVRRAIPQEEAIDALVALIQEYGDWVEPNHTATGDTNLSNLLS